MQKNQFIPSKKSPFFNINSDLDLMYLYMRQDSLTKENYSMDEFYHTNVEINDSNYDNLTVIIHYKCSEDYLNDERNLNTIFNYLKSIGVKYATVILEKNSDSKINFHFSKFDNLFDILQVIDMNSNFNKSLIFNNLLKKCVTPYVAIMDYGILVPEKSFDTALSLVDSFFDFVYASNNYVKGINNNDWINGFNFDIINTTEEYDLKYSSILFCNKKYLMNIGGFNPLFEKDFLLDMELLMRIVQSEYSLYLISNDSFRLPYYSELSKNDINLLISQFNLSKFNELDILVNQNKEMYMNSIAFKTEEFEFDTSNFLISVIIPVFNCEFFHIDRCISSLKNQTLGFENIEIILVDDASIYPSSFNIIKTYAEKYNNVKVISLELNSGAGIARNAGLMSATADYITFLDHDDYFVKDICEVYYNTMVEENLDILITNFIDLTNNPPRIPNWDFLNIENNEKNIMNYSDNMNIFSISPKIGTRIYRKEFLIENQLIFSNHKISENLIFNEKTLFEAKKIKLVNIPSIIHQYHYDSNENQESISLKRNFKLLIENIRSYKECYYLYLKYDVLELMLNNMEKIITDWITSYFFKIELTKLEINTIVDESHELFNIFKDSSQIINNQYYKLYNAFISKNYEEVYEIHKKNIHV